MSLQCYRCGTSLAALSLPLSRLDTCPECRTDLHVCRMCEHFAPNRSPRCAKEEAEEVRDDRRANFCDYFEPTPKAYTLEQRDAEAAAEAAMSALFAGDEPAQAQSGSSGGLSRQDELARREAESLFKK